MNRTFRFSTPILLFIALISFLPKSIIGQELKQDKNDIFVLSNLIYRSDDRLLNGKYYIPKHFFAEGHPYFISNDWVNSTLFIKGIKYEEVPLKYNIEDDHIIIKAVYKNRISKDILMHNTFVDSIYLNHHIIHNTANQYPENNIGFAELIYKGKNYAYLKHVVEFKDELSERLKYGKYLPEKKFLYLYDGSTFTLIQKKKNLYSYFPEQEKAIKQYMRKNDILFRKATAEQLTHLIQFCEHL
ncbi:MAG: hypothetical protein JW857_07135 [Bacteroidales bacterium]|nr:hypothetical protein [Bacteroidales bacterium]